MSNTGQETHMPIKADFDNSTDYIRMVIGGISSRATPTTLASKIAGLIESSATDSTVRSTSTSIAMSTADNIVLANTTLGDVNIILPSPAASYNSTSGKSKVYTISQAKDDGNTLSIVPWAGEPIYSGGENVFSIDLTGGSSVTLVTDGIEWFVISS